MFKPMYKRTFYKPFFLYNKRMSSKVQETRTVIYSKIGERREYTKKLIFLPKIFDVVLKLKKGDEIEFAINFETMNGGTFNIKRNEIIPEKVR